MTNNVIARIVEASPDVDISAGRYDSPRFNALTTLELAGLRHANARYSLGNRLNGGGWLTLSDHEREELKHVHQ